MLAIVTPDPPTTASAVTSAPTAPTGRREANKERTRAALVEAVYHLLESEGLDGLTAERVADEAGISRRTFFNYFPSVEAVMAHRAQELLQRLQHALTSRPTDEPLIDGANAVVDEMFTVKVLTEAIQTWRVCDQSPAATRYALEANDESAMELARDWARGRMSSAGETPSPLRIAVLTASALAAFEVARRHFMAHHRGRIDSRAREVFVATVRDAFETLRPSVESTR